MLIIGLSGLKGSGKSEVARRLIQNHGFVRGKFAGSLKEMLRVLLAYRGVGAATIERMIEGDLKELPTPHLNGRSPRHAMVTLGTEWGRDLIHPDLWVDVEVDRISRFRAVAPRIVFDDVRFENELDAIRRLGGPIWRVDRPGLAFGEHVSEHLRPDADLTLQNIGTLAYLGAQVDEAILALAPRAA